MATSNELCNFCGGTLSSPHHCAQCLPRGEKTWFAVANGLQGRVNRMQEFYAKQRDQITFFQGKFEMVKRENNQLRNKLRAQSELALTEP